MLNDLDAARADVIRSSGGGIAFLIAYGATAIITGVLAFFLPPATAALIFIFQGSVGLPAAFALERAFGFPRMAPDNPLRPLSIQLAMIQVVALPAVILTYSLEPLLVPAVFAAIVGGHFLPYVWLQRTRIYGVLGVGVALGAFAAMVVWGRASFPYIPLGLGLAYWAAALALRLTVRRP